MDPDLIARHTAVSEEVACAMAECRALPLRRDLRDFDHRRGRTREQHRRARRHRLYRVRRPGRTWFRGVVEARKFNFPGDRTRVRMFAAQGALDYLRRMLTVRPASA